jgi:hypothetical protein
MSSRNPGVRRTASVFFVLGVLALIQGAAFQAVPAGMAGYWPGDDGASPTTAADASGNGNPGTYTNGATTNSSSMAPLTFPNLSSMSFSGGTDCVSIPTFSWPAGIPVTVSYWTYVASGDVKNSSAFSVGNLDDPNRFQAHAPWGDGNLYWDYGTPNAGSGRVSTSFSSYLNAWTHIALVSEGTGGSLQAIYLNGTQVASVGTSSAPTVSLSGATIGGWPSAGLYVKGLIDDFRIYGRVLTDPEIAALASGASGPAAPTGLTAVGGNFVVNLSWTASTGPGTATYTIGRATASGGSPPGTYTTVATNVSGTTYIDGGVTNGTTYYYVVFAESFGPSGPSNEASATPNPAGAATPLGDKGGTNCHAGASPEGGIPPFAAGALVLALLLVRRR